MGESRLSLLLPSRHRLPQLQHALATAQATAAAVDSLEVVLYADSDDPGTAAFTMPGLQVQAVVGPRQSMGQMTAACWAAASGQLLMLANDDIVFRTPGWDARVREAFGRFPDGIALVWANDRLSGAPAHPFLSRTMVELLGGICPPTYEREFIDTHLADLFRWLAGLGHDRRVYLSDVEIEHCHVLARPSADPACRLPLQRVADESRYLLWEEERRLAALRLEAYISRQSAVGSRQ